MNAYYKSVRGVKWRKFTVYFRVVGCARRCFYGLAIAKINSSSTIYVFIAMGLSKSQLVQKCNPKILSTCAHTTLRLYNPHKKNRSKPHILIYYKKKNKPSTYFNHFQLTKNKRLEIANSFRTLYLRCFKLFCKKQIRA